MQEYDLINPVITTTTTWNSDKSILGKVLVKNGATLNIRNGATILFADSKRTSKNGYTFNGIEVEKGARLNVSENALLDVISCDQMWDGIQVKGDHTKEQPVSLPALHPDFGIVNLYNATISHARVGVYSYSATHLAEFPIKWFPGFKKGSGIIKAFKTTFSNNAISVFYGPYKFDHRYELNECTFINDALLRDQESFPDRSLVAHIVAFESRNLSFPGCVFKNTTPVQFSDYISVPGFLGNFPRGTGILGYDSEIIVQAKPGITVKYPYFEGMHTGIHSQCWTGFPDGLQVSQAIFNDVPKGITVLGSDYDEIVGCTFSLPVNYISVIEGVTSKKYGTDVWAVYHHGGINPLITQNTLSGTSYYENIETDEPDATISSYGIIVGSSYGGSQVYKNSSAGVYTGVQTEYSNDALTISCNDYSNHQQAWNIGEPVEFDPITYTTPSLANQGEACIPITSTIINTFTGNDVDIYSHVAFDYFAFGDPEETVPEGNGDVTVEDCAYPPGSIGPDCSDWYDLLADLDFKPVAEWIDEIGDISDLRSSALLTHLALRSLMGKDQMDSVVYLLEQLDNSYDLPILFNVQLHQAEISACNSLISFLPNQTDAEKSWKKMAKLLLERDTLLQEATDINAQQMQKLLQLTTFNNWVTPRASSLLDANTFAVQSVFAKESDTTLLRQHFSNDKQEAWQLYPNPTDQTIHLLSENSPIGHVVIISLDGRIQPIQILQQEEQYITIDVSGLPAGLYLVRGVNAGYSEHTHTFVKL